MLNKSKPKPKSKSTISSSNISKCTTKPLHLATEEQLKVVDGLILKLKAENGDDMDASWEKTILHFKKELQEEELLLKPSSSSVVDNNNNNNNNNTNNNNNNNGGNNNGNNNGGGGIEKRVEGSSSSVRAKFCVPLSRREMEKDFLDMGQRRLPRKPKKRPKLVQNRLDTLFPGLWLTEIHADLYRVSETKKR